jgi:hypothetical protein
MRVYYFLSAQHALGDIRGRKIKIATPLAAPSLISVGD